jgi:hypothetical protein
MINIVVALATESRPLIEHFKLSQERSSTAFRIFRNDWLRLVVTGMGRVSCAAGVATLATLDAGRSTTGLSAWLNVGTAGHGRHEIGAGIHAVSILEAATDRRWYPTRILELPGIAGQVCTVDVVEREYQEPYAYDMEASAFYATALRYSTTELCQVYKIISDNGANGPATVDKPRIRESVIRHLPAIEEMAAGLSSLADEVNATRPKLDDFDYIISRWHFSVAQQHQLRTLLGRWATLSGGAPLLDDELNRCPSARSLLAEIKARLEAVYGEGRTVEN